MKERIALGLTERQRLSEKKKVELRITEEEEFCKLQPCLFLDRRGWCIRGDIFKK